MSDDGTPLLVICPVHETNGKITVDLSGSPNKYEAEYEYNYKTQQWETIYEIFGSSEIN